MALDRASRSAQEVVDVAEAVTPHYRVLVYTAAHSGLRAGELGGLRRKDVDLLHGKLSVHRALKDINTSSENIAAEDKGLIFGPTKTGERRTIGLPRFLRDMLEVHLVPHSKAVCEAVEERARLDSNQ